MPQPRPKPTEIAPTDWRRQVVDWPVRCRVGAGLAGAVAAETSLSWHDPSTGSVGLAGVDLREWLRKPFERLALTAFSRAIRPGRRLSTDEFGELARAIATATLPDALTRWLDASPFPAPTPTPSRSAQAREEPRGGVPITWLLDRFRAAASLLGAIEGVANPLPPSETRDEADVLRAHAALLGSLTKLAVQLALGPAAPAALAQADATNDPETYISTALLGLRTPHPGATPPASWRERINDLTAQVALNRLLVAVSEDDLSPTAFAALVVSSCLADTDDALAAALSALAGELTSPAAARARAEAVHDARLDVLAEALEELREGEREDEAPRDIPRRQIPMAMAVLARLDYPPERATLVIALARIAGLLPRLREYRHTNRIFRPLAHPIGPHERPLPARDTPDNPRHAPDDDASLPA